MYDSLRFKYDDVKQYFTDQGCELLETEYKNARTKMRYRCSCGNESSIVFDSFKRGNRCKECGNKRNSQRQKMSHKEAAAKFEEIGCELLSEYKFSREKVKYRCSCGNVTEGIPNNVWRRKSCSKCALERRSGKNHYMWKEDREQHKLDQAFRQRSYKLIRMVLRVTGRVKNKRSAKMLGYDYKQLQEHITNHPDWSKVKDGNWHVDHIFPIKAFMDYGIKDLKVINDLDNLRPMDAVENSSKNAKYDPKEFELWLESKGVEYA